MKKNFIKFISLLIGISGLHSGFTQEIAIGRIQTVPIPDSLISSEQYLSHSNGHLSLAMLTVTKGLLQPAYSTRVMSYDLKGGAWEVEASARYEQAADPWIHRFEDGILVSDISEGNRFHLKTERINLDGRKVMHTHGLGHDHSMILQDKIRGISYLISTQKTATASCLYIAASPDQGLTFSTFIHSPFQGVNLSAKQPIISDKGMIHIPVVLTRSWGADLAFDPMHTWLVTATEMGEVLSTPSFLTNRAGARHHLLLEIGNEMIFLYTSAEQDKLEWIQTVDKNVWSAPRSIPSTHTWFNLDAATTINEREALVIWTERVSDNAYQKFVSLISTVRDEIMTVPLGVTSRPSDENGWVKRAWPQGGDYCGLVQISDHTFYCSWSHAIDGLFKPQFVKITIP